MKKLLEKFNTKEFNTIQALISKKGFDVKIEMASNSIVDSSNFDNKYFISSTHGRVLKEEVIDRKIIFLNESFEFQEVNLFALLDSAANSFNNFYAFISGEIVPKNSIVTSTEFPNIRLVIDKVEQIRPMTTLSKYLLVRS